MRSVKEGKAVLYVYDDAGTLVSRISAEENADFVYLGGQLLARISDGKVLYYLSDHLGTTTMAVDASGTVVWSEELGVFGNITGKGEFADDYAYYTGKEYEAETGLYYFNARWYDAELGRFISEDPVKDGLNWYAYCSNNPLVHTDPTGLEVEVYENFMIYDDEDMGTEEDNFAGLNNLEGYASEFNIDIFNRNDASLEEKYGDVLNTDTSKKLSPPVNGVYPSEFYGKRVPEMASDGTLTNPDHYALDIPAPRGTIVRSITDGTIAEPSENAVYGNNIIIDHGVSKSLSAHLENSNNSLPIGSIVHLGAPIGRVGNTGKTVGQTGVHLHFAWWNQTTNRKYDPSILWAGVDQEGSGGNY